MLKLDFKKIVATALCVCSSVAFAEGFVLTKIRPDSLYYKAGLRDGDVLIKVDEFTCGDVSCFSKVEGRDKVKATVKRSGKPMTVTLENVKKQ